MAATSYGSITIVDITDIGEFSVYPTANSPRTQIYNPDSNTYTPDWSGSNPDTSLRITPVAYYASKNVSTSATYTWQRRDGAGNLTSLGANETVITVDGNTGVLKVNNNVLSNSTSGIISYVVTAHYTVDGVPLEAVGEIDFSLTRQGTIAKTAKINGENIFKYDTSGALTPSGKTITLTGTVTGVSISGWKYYNPSSQSADTNGYVTYPNSTAASTLVVNPSDNVFTNDSVTIKLVTNDVSIYDLITITKLKDGARGQTTVAAVLSNENQTLPIDSDNKVLSYVGATSTLTIYNGSSNVTSGWHIDKTYSPAELSSLDTATNDNEVDFTSTSLSSTVLSGIDPASVTFTCSKTGEANIVKTFSIAKTKAGIDGTSPTIYSLESNTLVVNADPTVGTGTTHANPNPSSITFNAYRQIGSNPKEPYSGRIQFYIDDSASISAETTTDASTRTINFNNSPWNAANRVKAVLYAAGANTDQLDVQTVVVVCDGNKGDTGDNGANGYGAVNVILGNEADVIPCDSDNHPIPNGTGTDSTKFIIDIPFEGYQGTIVKTTAVSASAIPTSDTGLQSIISADTSTAGHVKYKIPNTATLVENGQISLTFTVNAKDFNGQGQEIDTTVSVTKLYTWTRSSAPVDGINGINAVILQVNAEDGTIFVNNDGTLYAKGMLYDGASEATGETYTWYQYKDSTYKLVNTTNTPNVVTGHGTKNISTGVWTWTNGANGSTNTTSDMIKIEAGAVDGYASFKVVAHYNDMDYVQYISFIDKSDPLQVSLHSTVGTQIKNGQGVGCVYARVIRGDSEIDTVPQGIQSGTSWPTSSVLGDYFVLLTTNSDHSLRTATLYKKTGDGSSDWTAINNVSGEARQCNYQCTFRDRNNNPISTTVPYQDTSNKKNNQFIYIDADLIDSKIVIDCKVTLD